MKFLILSKRIISIEGLMDVSMSKFTIVNEVTYRLSIKWNNGLTSEINYKNGEEDLFKSDLATIIDEIESNSKITRKYNSPKIDLVDEIIKRL